MDVDADVADDPRREAEAWAALVSVVRRLLAPGGCPWDREQTPETLRQYVIEEAYELVEAIEAGAPKPIREELGDLLMQVVFLSQIFTERRAFTVADVCDAIRDKLVRRHPHVFAGAEAKDADAVLARWEKQKREERGGRGALDGVPKNLPALQRASRIGEKAALTGFDWPEERGVRRKIDEEMAELEAAVAEKNPARVEAELGDVLFALASYARHLRVEPEAALRGTLDRFTRRFAIVEERVRRQGRRLEDCTADELDRLWNDAKQVA